MARIWVDGFENGDVSQYYPTAFTTITSVSGDINWSGTYFLRLYGYLYKELISSLPEVFVKFRYKTASYQGFLVFKDSSNASLLTISTNSTGKIVAHSGYYSTAIATSSLSIEKNKVYLFEIRYKPLNSGGVVQIKIDGSLFIDFAGDTTSGLESVKFIALESQSDYGYFDDYVIDDANWIGNTKIQAIVPTGAGNSSQWTPSTGSNYACVDERPSSDADFVSTNTVNNIDTYAFGDMTGLIGSIKSISAMARCGYSGIPVPKNIKLVTRIAGTDYVGDDRFVPMSFANLYQLWENNPATSSEWSESIINGSEFGIKAVA